MKTAAFVLISLVIAAAAVRQDEDLASKPLSDPANARATIFFAVLEGLYLEGVQNDDVDLVLTRAAKDGNFVNFVYGCPICAPTIDALLVYRQRCAFQPTKAGTEDTFGSGFPEITRIQLRSGDPKLRLATIQAFIDRCLARKLASFRLSEKERGAWREQLALWRKVGMESLHAAKASGASSATIDVGSCPSCEGAVEGSGHR